MFTSRMSRRALVAAAVVASIGGACASDTGPADGTLDEEGARARLTTSCETTNARLDALVQPADRPAQAGWAADIATALDEQANEIRSLVLLDEDLRVDVRAFAENTAQQAAAWRELSELLVGNQNLDETPRFAELTTEIPELSLGRDDLSDELEVPACRRS